MTCFHIWHYRWDNGAKRPRPRCGRDIQRRDAGTSKAAGKCKRHDSDADEDVNEEEEERDEGGGQHEDDAGSAASDASSTNGQEVVMSVSGG
jgi:hypothetical protein